MPKIKYIYLFLKGGLQVNRFVSHHKLLGYIGLGSGLVVSWCKLYFANHQTTCVPKARKKNTQRESGLVLHMSLFLLQLLDAIENWAESMVWLWAYVLLFNDFIYIVGCVCNVSFNLKVHATSLQQNKTQINDLFVKHLKEYVRVNENGW